MSRWFTTAAPRNTDEAIPGRRAWVEQGELWQREQSSAPEGASTGRRPASLDFDFSKTEIVRLARPKHSGAKSLRIEERAVENRRGSRTANIGRFMQVNRTLQAGRGNDYEVVRSPRHVSADYDLWKGPSGVVTFFLGG